MYLLPDLRGCTRFLLMLCLALAPLGVAAGEAADPPLFVQVRTTYVQPGMAAKFEEFLTRLNAARYKAGEDRGTFVTRSRTGRNAYYGITLYDRYSDLQGSGLGSLFNEQELAEVTGLISESVRGGMVQTFFARRTEHLCRAGRQRLLYRSNLRVVGHSLFGPSHRLPGYGKSYGRGTR